MRRRPPKEEPQKTQVAPADEHAKEAPENSVSVKTDAPPQKKVRQWKPIRMPGQLQAINRIRAAGRSERAARAVEMRMNGMTLRQIADELGYKQLSNVARLLAHEFKQAAMVSEDTKQSRYLRNASLDQRERTWKAQQGAIQRRIAAEQGGRATAEDLEQMAQIERALAKIHDQRVHLNGLSVSVDSRVIVEHEHRDFLERLRAALPADRYEEVLRAVMETEPTKDRPGLQ